MNKVVLGFWCFAVFFSVLCAACNPQESHIWTTVVMPLICFGIIGFNRKD